MFAVKTGSVVYVLCVLAMFALIGCADSGETQPPRSASVTPTTQRRQHAECLVCKYNADLACVDVDVDANTPSYVCNGKTYYFCSQECRNEFVKHPDRYAPLAAK